MTCNLVLDEDIQHSDLIRNILQNDYHNTLVNIHHSTQLQLCLCVMRTFKTHCLQNFQMYTTVLSTVVPTLCITALGCIYVVTESLHFLTTFTHFALPATNLSCFYTFYFFLVSRTSEITWYSFCSVGLISLIMAFRMLPVTVHFLSLPSALR